jgi:RecB family endonuclease NucS
MRSKLEELLNMLDKTKTLIPALRSNIVGVCLKMIDVLMEPSVAEAEDLIIKNTGKCLLIVGNCNVEYHGRASSKLGSGERIVMIKEDGALLVHRAAGYDPVNWMPGTGVIYNVRVLKTEKTKDNVLAINAVRQKPYETIKVFFDKVQLVSALSLVDSGEFSLYASEEDMQKAILLKPSLLEEGFKPISYEKKVEPGFVDIYGVDKNNELVVVEIKRRTAGKEAAVQLAKYIDAIKTKADRGVRGILAAPNLAKDAQRVLETLGLEFKHLDPRKCAETLQTAETKKLSEFLKET